MKNTIILLALFSGLGLAACDKTPNTVVVPVPVAGPAGATGATGQSGDAGVQGKSGKAGDEGIKGETGKAGVEGVQGEPGKTGGDTTIIVTPPEAVKPAN